MIAVYAGSINEYRSFEKAYDGDKKELVYIAIERDARGQVYDRVIRVGTWYEKYKIYDRVDEFIHIRQEASDGKG
jgi:hypothetical protein